MQPVYQQHSFALPAQAHIFQIVAMWSVLALSTLLSIVGSSFLVLELPALVLAIYLVCQKSLTDKINGWIVIGLFIFGFFVMIAIGQAALQNAQPRF